MAYSVSAGLQRALAMLAAVVLAQTNTAEAVGAYILSQTIAQLCVPLLTWNITVALTREARHHPFGAQLLLTRVIQACTVIGLAGLAFYLAQPDRAWFALGAVLGAAEAVFSCVVASFLGREESEKVVLVGLEKTAAFAFLLTLAHLGVISISTMLLLLAGVIYLVAFISVANRFQHPLTVVRQLGSEEAVTPSMMVKYSLATLPHTAALWLSISADRLLLGAFEGKAVVAKYTMNYVIAQSVMVAVSGVISALPPQVANNAEAWRQPKKARRWLESSAVAYALLMFVNDLFVYVDANYLHLIPGIDRQSYFLVWAIASSFYLSIYYVLFASYLYLNRRTAALTFSGLVLAPLNLIVTGWLIYVMRMEGAALGLMFSYASFGVAYCVAARVMEPVVKELAVVALRVVTKYLFVTAVISLCFWWIDA